MMSGGRNRAPCLLVLLLAFVLAACADGRYSGTLIFEGAHSLGPEAQLPGDVLIRAGAVELGIGSQVAGSVYVLGGSLLVNGAIGGDLVVLDGQVVLGPAAEIGGDVRVSGGTTTGLDVASIGGDVITGLALPLNETTDTAGWEAAVRWLVGALVLAALGGLWTQRQPQAVENIATAATAYWPASVALGLLALLVLPILLVMMALTIVLLPLVLALGLALGLALAMGIVALGSLVGQGLRTRWMRRLAPGWATFGGTLLVMGLYGLPLVGGLLFGTTAVLLFGAVLLSRFGTRTYQPPPILVEADDLGSYRRP